MVRVVFPKSTKVIIKLVEQASHWALFLLIYRTKARQSFLIAATLRHDYSVTWPRDAGGDFFIFSAAVVCFTLDTWSSVHSWRNGGCVGFCSVSSSYHLSLSCALVFVSPLGTDSSQFPCCTIKSCIKQARTASTHHIARELKQPQSQTPPRTALWWVRSSSRLVFSLNVGAFFGFFYYNA